MPFELADSDLQLNPERDELTSCPTVFWSVDECNFVVCKLGKQRFYCQFFYGPDEEYGTGRPWYDDVFDAVTAVLKIRSEHALKRRWTFSSDA